MFGEQGFDMNALLAQAQAMQSQLARAQEELAAKQVLGSAGGDLVQVTVNGAGELLAVNIKPEAWDEDDPSTLGDLIVAAVRDANKKVAGNQAFKFIGDSEFHKKAGELRFTQTDTQTIVEADANGDGKTDFSVTLNSIIDLVKADFIL